MNDESAASKRARRPVADKMRNRQRESGAKACRDGAGGISKTLVDKKAGLLWKRVDIRRFQAIQNRRKKALASVSGFCESVIVQIALSQRFSFKKARLQAGFLFLGHSDFLQTVKKHEKAGRRESAWPSQSLPEDLSVGKHYTTSECPFSSIQPVQRRLTKGQQFITFCW